MQIYPVQEARDLSEWDQGNNSRKISLYNKEYEKFPLKYCPLA